MSDYTAHHLTDLIIPYTKTPKAFVPESSGSPTAWVELPVLDPDYYPGYPQKLAEVKLKSIAAPIVTRVVGMPLDMRLGFRWKGLVQAGEYAIMPLAGINLLDARPARPKAATLKLREYTPMTPCPSNCGAKLTDELYCKNCKLYVPPRNFLPPGEYENSNLQGIYHSRQAVYPLVSTSNSEISLTRRLGMRHAISSVAFGIYKQAETDSSVRILGGFYDNDEFSQLRLHPENWIQNHPSEGTHHKELQTLEPAYLEMGQQTRKVERSLVWQAAEPPEKHELVGIAVFQFITLNSFVFLEKQGKATGLAAKLKVSKK